MSPAAIVEASGVQPYGIAFSPDGARLAVGYSKTRSVDVHDGHTLDRLWSPNTSGIEKVEFTVVTWSRDGRTLLAGGRKLLSGSGDRLFAWSEGGNAARPRRNERHGAGPRRATWK